MNESVKHVGGTATSIVGFFGAVTLSDVNVFISIICGMAGTAAAVYTIYSIWDNRRHKK